MPSSPATAQQAGAWASLAALFVHTLLAHRSSLASEEPVGQLEGLLQPLLHMATAVASGGSCAWGALGPGVVSLDAEAFGQQLVCVLEQSGHAALRGLLQPRVLPCATALVRGLQRYSPALQPAGDVGEPLLLLGHAWLLLGSMRLQLLQPPPGIDPAGKYGLRRRHLADQIQQQLEPEIWVSQAVAGA